LSRSTFGVRAQDRDRLGNLTSAGRPLGGFSGQTALRERHEFRLRAGGVAPREGIVELRPRCQLAIGLGIGRGVGGLAGQDHAEDGPEAEDV
jgi:hypothetical protein